MLAPLPHGMAIDPETVKYFSVRPDRPKGPAGPVVFTVIVRTDDDKAIPIASFDKHEEAVSLSQKCGRLVNKASD